MHLENCPQCLCVPLILSKGVELSMVEKRDSRKKGTPHPVWAQAAAHLLESLWCQDALGVMLAGIQVLGTEVQFLLTQLACNVANSISLHRKTSKLPVRGLHHESLRLVQLTMESKMGENNKTKLSSIDKTKTKPTNYEVRRSHIQSWSCC